MTEAVVCLTCVSVHTVGKSEVGHMRGDLIQAQLLPWGYSAITNVEDGSKGAIGGGQVRS